MIDLDAIRARDAADMQILPNLELFAQHNPDDAELKGAIDMVRDRRALLAYVDALAKDAERYRWLQEHVVATGLALWMGQHQTLSEAVDAARVAPTVEPKP